MATCCYECGKIIKGELVHIQPSNLAIKLYNDFPRAYHKKCYDKLEAQAAKELTK